MPTMDMNDIEGDLGNIAGAFWYDQIAEAAVGSPPMLPTIGHLGSFAGEALVPRPAERMAPAPTTATPSTEGYDNAAGDQDVPASASEGQRRCQAIASRGGSKATDEKQAKLDHLRARNRVNQARYRERQNARKVGILEAHEVAAAELEQARGEQELLQMRNALLEKLLETRDKAVDILQAVATDGAAVVERSQQSQGGQQQTPASPQQSQHAEGYIEPRLVEIRAESSEDGSGRGGSGDGSMARRTSSGCSGAASAAEVLFRGRNHPLLQEHPMEVEGRLSEHIRALRDDAFTAHVASCPVSEPACPDERPPWQKSDAEAAAVAAAIAANPEIAERLREQHPEEFLRDWQMLVRQVNDVLTAHDLTKHGVLEVCLQPVALQLSIRITLALQNRADCVHALFSTSREAPPGTWDRAIDAMALSAAQHWLIRQIWEVYVAKVERLRTEEGVVMQAMQGLATSSTVTPDSLHGRTLSSMVNQYISLVENAGKLSAYKDAEFVALLQLMGSVGQCLAPVQKARCTAACYPHFPDTLAIVRRLLKEEGQPPDGDAGSVAVQQQQQQQETTTALSRTWQTRL